MIKIFVGSSSGARTQAKKFMEGCTHPNVKYLPWWEQFGPGFTLLDELDRIRKEVGAVILLLTPEASSTNSKGTEIVVANQNVLFEFGYFYAALGKSKVALAKYGDINLPSDLGGYIHIFGSGFFHRGASVPVGKRTKGDFNRWLDTMLSKPPR
ncbi:MAG TPA: TIR domain-containing protein [Candidatus Binataceae bacterium]|nr:TIR domain-containing protein [Candidatus Binataceae bacterium]